MADNGLSAVLVFDPSGKLLKTIEGSKAAGGGKGNASKAAKPGQFKDISAVCVAPSGEYVVADSRIQVFTPEGVFVREIGATPVGAAAAAGASGGKGKGGRYGGLSCDANGFLMATRTEKARSFIQVFKFATGELYSTIDSHGCKMKRPTGLAVMGGGEDGGRHLVVVDIGNDCVRKYRYF